MAALDGLLEEWVAHVVERREAGTKVRFAGPWGRVGLTLADAALCDFLVQEEAEASGAVRGRAG